MSEEANKPDTLAVSMKPCSELRIDQDSSVIDQCGLHGKIDYTL